MVVARGKGEDVKRKWAKVVIGTSGIVRTIKIKLKK